MLGPQGIKRWAMLVNVSYNNPEITRKIDEKVGKPFTLKERWTMKGIGSPKLFITEASMEALKSWSSTKNSQ